MRTGKTHLATLLNQQFRKRYLGFRQGGCVVVCQGRAPCGDSWVGPKIPGIRTPPTLLTRDKTDCGGSRKVPSWRGSRCLVRPGAPLRIFTACNILNPCLRGGSGRAYGCCGCLKGWLQGRGHVRALEAVVETRARTQPGVRGSFRLGADHDEVRFGQQSICSEGLFVLNTLDLPMVENGQAQSAENELWRHVAGSKPSAAGSRTGLSARSRPL